MVVYGKGNRGRPKKVWNDSVVRALAKKGPD